MFARNFTVMPSDVSLNGRIKLRSLLDCFQDTASLAVESIEGTATELYSRGYAWVLVKYEIEFTADLPRLDDTFNVETFHDPNHGYNTLRAFRTTFANAKTSWLLADVKTGRAVKPSAHIPGITSKDNGDINTDFSEIPDITDATKSVSINVKYHDLDYNSHVNHAAYFEWVNDYDYRQGETLTLKYIRADFRSGARLGENVRLDFSVSKNTTLCNISRPGQSKPCAKFMLVWDGDII